MDLPQCKTQDFRTRFQPKRGPGFFPGTGGYFHGCSPESSARIVFFGTDFGTESYWEKEVTEGGGEKRTQATLCNLRCLVEDAGVDPCSCHLTNAVLALAKGDDMTGNDLIYTHKRYRRYLENCGEFHRTWISQHKPDLAVLMGTQNVDSYRRLVFNRVFPTLDDEWADFRTPWRSIYDAKKELVRTRPGEPDVLWMFHPSYRQSNPQFPELKSTAERKRRREEIWARTVWHLTSYA